MKEKELNVVALKRQLSALASWKVILFGLSVCERMFPNFVAFADRTGHKGEDVLRSSLDHAWNLLRREAINADCSDMAEACAAVAPDADDYDDPYTSSAMDAAVGAASIMRAFSGNAAESVAEIASLARDSIDLWIFIDEDFSTDPNRERKTIEHPLMQEELRRQREGLQFLKKFQGTSGEALDLVELSWRSPKEGLLTPSRKL